MEIINDTPFTFGMLPGRIYFPDHSLTLMVKGTFKLTHQKNPELVEEQVFPEGDVFYDGDDEGRGSVFYESDFAYAKTASDCFLVGHCQGAQAARVRRVDFKVGERLKSLAVFGERQWTSGNAISDPQPFDAIPLRYEYALGGASYKANPVGKGASDQQVQGFPLPNIEFADQLMQSPQARPPVAGVGPINRNWPARNLKLGTYTHSYVKERWPWFPEDFDWSYFNSAPVDQQVKPYLAGDEQIFVTSMHREHEVFETKLPGFRVRLFTSTAESPNFDAFSEVKTNLDTLWINMDDLSMRLVWRGWLKVSNDEYPELKHCFVYAEPVTIETPIKVVFERFHEAWLELQDDYEEDEGPGEDKQRPTTEEEQAAMEQRLAESRQALRAQLVGMGLDPKDIDNAIEKADAEEEKRQQDKPQPKVWTRELFMMALQKRRDFSQEDLTALDLSGLTLSGVNFQQTDLTGANFSHATLNECDLSQAILSKCNFSAARLSQCAIVESDLTDADFQQSYLDQVDMSGCVAEGANFNHMQATQWVMVDASVGNANLQNINAPGSDLSGSDFSYSNLSGAVLYQSKLIEASLEGSLAKQINLMGSDLTQLRASEAMDAEGGNFCQVIASASIWEGANLNGTNFTYAVMEGATLNKAQFHQADISAADFKGGKFMGADLTATKAVMINLFEGSFEKAKLIQTDLRGSNLYGVEFLDAEIRNPLLESANLHATKLAGAATGGTT